MTPSADCILDLMKKTLCHVQSGQLGLDIPDMVATALQTLLDQGLVIQQRMGPEVMQGPKVTSQESRPEVIQRSKVTSEKSESEVVRATESQPLPMLEVTKLGRAVFKGH